MEISDFRILKINIELSEYAAQLSYFESITGIYSSKSFTLSCCNKNACFCQGKKTTKKKNHTHVLHTLCYKQTQFLSENTTTCSYNFLINIFFVHLKKKSSLSYKKVIIIIKIITIIIIVIIIIIQWKSVLLHPTFLLDPAAVFSGSSVDTRLISTGTSITPTYHTSQKDPPTWAYDGEWPTRVTLEDE